MDNPPNNLGPNNRGLNNPLTARMRVRPEASISSPTRSNSKINPCSSINNNIWMGTYSSRLWGSKAPGPKARLRQQPYRFYSPHMVQLTFILGRKLQGVGQILLSTLGLICLVVVGILWSATTLDPAFYVFAVITFVIYIAMGCWMLFDLIRIVKKKPPMDRDANGIPLK